MGIMNKILVIAIACLTIVSGARAQSSYRWDIVHSQIDSVSADTVYEYNFTALDSWDEICIAAGIKQNVEIKTTDRNEVMFFRSTNGGRTWTEQDPGLPHFKGTNQDYSIKKVQQIDSVNAVGLGDSGLIVRTTDGGNTWTKQNLNIFTIADFDVDFSDPMTGIVLTGTGDSNIMITSDGGTNWEPAAFQPINLVPGTGASLCHSYGEQSFRACMIGGVTQYVTTDDWNTFDTLTPISPWTDDSDIIGSGEWRFYGTDTIVAYGATGIGGIPYTFITVSTDGGVNWVRSNVPRNVVVDLQSMSSLDRNIVFCSGNSQPPHILSSTDHGMSWRVDTIAFDTTGYSPGQINGVTVTPNGNAVAIFNGGTLALGLPVTSGVATSASIQQSLDIYPNPFTQSTEITFTSPSAGYAEVSIVNMLGVEVARLFSGELGAGEHSFTWDAGKDAYATQGVYECLVRMNGQVQTLPVVLMR
jgi:photosystem II stability/assembly factor-like uncharacterized protein